MLNVLLASMANQSSAYLGTGDSPTPAGNAHPSIVPYQTLRAADGVVTIACGNDKQFAALTAALGMAELATDPKFSTNTLRVRNRGEVIERLEEQLAAMTVDDVIDLLLDAGVPAGAVNDIAGAFRYAIELGLDPVVYIDQGGQQVPQVASPLRMSGTPVNYRRAPPTLGSG
jgi:crotonobetainyl-CoA:carnitine CoA-transferase CaiB-like acyl-CoA transferase